MVPEKDWRETKLCDVGVPLSPSHILGNEENNRRSEKRNEVGFYNSFGRSGLC